MNIVSDYFPYAFGVTPRHRDCELLYKLVLRRVAAIGASTNLGHTKIDLAYVRFGSSTAFEFITDREAANQSFPEVQTRFHENVVQPGPLLQIAAVDSASRKTAAIGQKHK